MSSLSLTDILLVNRGGQSYKLQVSDMAEILDDDLLLVNRGGSSYKITGDDFKNSVIGIQPGANDISISPSVTGSGTLGDPFILTAVQIGPWGANTQCNETITINGQAAATAVIWTDISASASGARFEQPDSVTNSSGVWTGKLVYNDTPASTAQTTFVGNIKIGSLYFRWNVQQNETATRVAVIGSATITENDVTGARYTSSAFTANITMTDEGLPTSDKELKAYVEGSLQKYAETSEIVNVGTTTKDGSAYQGGTQSSANAGTVGGSYDDIFDNPTNDVNKYVDVLGIANSYSMAIYDLPTTLVAYNKVEICGNNSQGGSYLELEFSDGSNTKIYLYNSGTGTTSKNVTGGPWNITKLTLVAFGGAASPTATLLSITVDGVAFGGNLTELTLDDDQDLADFSAGDSVSSKPTYIPQTSEIVGVSTASGLTTLTLSDITDFDKLSVGDLVEMNGTVTATSTVFATETYSGNSGTQTITNGVNLASNGGLVWMKNYTSNNSHGLLDTERGTASFMSSDLTDAEKPYTEISSFNSNGFTLQSYSGWVNGTGASYASWAFRKAPDFFDIVTWDGNGVDPRTIDHNLGSIPGMIIVKRTDSADDWIVYHKDVTTGYLKLNENSVIQTRTDYIYQNPTNTTFSVGGFGPINATGGSYVAYLFAENEPNIKCGTYTGAYGGGVAVGFETQWLMIKAIDSSEDWKILDNERAGTSGGLVTLNETLAANTLNSQANIGSQGVRITSTSFITPDLAVAGINSPGTDYIYVAIKKDAEITEAVTPAGLFQSSNTSVPSITLTPQVTGWSANTSNVAKGPAINGSGTISSIDVANKQIVLSPYSTNWLANEGISVLGDVEVAAAKLYTVLSSSGQITSLVPADPGYTTMAGNPNYTLTFPATFPSGDAPDTDLPVGTTIKLDVRASNTAGNTDVTTSALTPVYNGEYVEDMFITYVYEGTGSAMTITNGIDLVGEGGLVWLKYRNAAEPGQILDTVRGKTKDLRPDSYAGEGTNTDRISAWNADGFTLSTNSVVNTNGGKHVSWTFRQAPGFFDVVTYNGTGSTQDIPHSLGSVPGMIIVKKSSAVDNWQVWHKSISTGSLSSNDLMKLDQDVEKINRNSFIGTANSSTFEVGTDNAVNASGGDYVAYIFADGDQADAQIFGDAGDESIIKCGSYTPSGSDLQVDCGWEPQWLMVKDTDSGTVWKNWGMFDNMRGVVTDGNDTPLMANLTTEEGGTYMYGSDNIVDFNANGFLVKNGISLAGTSGNTYIYVAIRRGPMKTPEDATKVFNVVKTSSQPMSVGFTPDLAIVSPTDNSGAKYFVPRLTNADMNSVTNGAESTSGSYFKFDLQNNFSHSDFLSGWETINWMFKRAPGFFDVVCYDGTSSAQAVTHNLLGVVPEMIITKNRDSAESWTVYHSGIGATKALILDTDAAANTYTPYWNDTAPTSTQFTVGTYHGANKSGDDFIAYLFATLDGISKVGTYDGSLDPINIDCGFSGGARFVLIKATTRNGEWHVWDSARGITTGNSPYLKLDLPNAQSTADYLDPYTGGFSVVGAGTNDGAINAVGESYIYLAIA